MHNVCFTARAYHFFAEFQVNFVGKNREGGVKKMKSLNGLSRNMLKIKAWHATCYTLGMRIKFCFCGGYYVYVAWW